MVTNGTAYTLEYIRITFLAYNLYVTLQSFYLALLPLEFQFINYIIKITTELLNKVQH
jgi:hypothetical protein